ncbi:MAG: 30S ribosomal protein S27ae [Candidatus Altiarchaeales archaeon ex4484_43]|nr:MAG: 30S ribosomal protein S27ae [Candidatus Altiarchaeales archaeon ex4484_43]RLI88567.1 MAG: 30S ribosomal protein S27ae [Candidatus Altiarchaeales archaeon]
MSKREKGKRKTRKIWELYEIKDGRVIRKNRICPKCGEGVFLAKHGDRLSCGKCGYTESKKK